MLNSCIFNNWNKYERQDVVLSNFKVFKQFLKCYVDEGVFNMFMLEMFKIFPPHAIKSDKLVNEDELIDCCLTGPSCTGIDII